MTSLILVKGEVIVHLREPMFTLRANKTLRFLANKYLPVSKCNPIKSGIKTTESNRHMLNPSCFKSQNQLE